MTYYTFARQFHYTPQQVRDLNSEEFAMLAWGIDEENRVQEAAQKGKKARPMGKGGSSANGESVTSVASLMAAANKH